MDEAITEYQNALQINPSYAEADVNLWQSPLLQKGRAGDEAILALAGRGGGWGGGDQHALQLDTNLARPWPTSNLGDAFSCKKEKPG